MLSRLDQPIAAIATAPGRGAVGIVRVSGKDLFWYGAWTVDALPRLAGVILSDMLSYADPLWWLSGLVLGGATALMCWRIAPPELIAKGRSLLRR